MEKQSLEKQVFLYFEKHYIEIDEASIKYELKNNLLSISVIEKDNSKLPIKDRNITVLFDVTEKELVPIYQSKKDFTIIDKDNVMVEEFNKKTHQLLHLQRVKNSIFSQRHLSINKEAIIKVDASLLEHGCIIIEDRYERIYDLWKQIYVTPEFTKFLVDLYSLESEVCLFNIARSWHVNIQSLLHLMEKKREAENVIPAVRNLIVAYDGCCASFDILLFLDYDGNIKSDLFYVEEEQFRSVSLLGKSFDFVIQELKNKLYYEYVLPAIKKKIAERHVYEKVEQAFLNKNGD